MPWSAETSRSPVRTCANVASTGSGRNSSPRKKRSAVGGCGIPRSNPDKDLFLDEGITKAEFVDYYRAVGRVMLPHLRGRPSPQGRRHGDLGGPRRHRNPRLPGQKASITPHPWLRRADRPDCPDRLVFDQALAEGVAGALGGEALQPVAVAGGAAAAEGSGELRFEQGPAALDVLSVARDGGYPVAQRGGQAVDQDASTCTARLTSWASRHGGSLFTACPGQLPAIAAASGKGHHGSTYPDRAQAVSHARG